jgi:hypothetical protein
LFRGRYKSILVEEESYLLELVRYIHRNPLRGKICSSLKEFPWSSHHGYVSNAQKWDWLHKRFLLNMLVDKPGKAKRAYLEFVLGKDSTEILAFYEKKNVATVLGSNDFIKWVKIKFFENKKHGEVPEAKQLAPSVREIKKVVCQVYRIDEQALEQTTRGQINEPRNVAIYLARKYSGLRLVEIGDAFGHLQYSSVSSVVLRTESLLSQRKQLQKKIGMIKRKLSKSQTKT